jgi:hypothetical protein
MNSEIHSAIISAFEKLLNPTVWVGLSDAFKYANYKHVYVKPAQFETNSLIEMRTDLIFNDNEQLELFLNMEHKRAIETQKFDWAAIVHKKQMNLKDDDKSFDGVYLKYSIQDISSGVCELLFETNILSFRDRLVNEFVSYSSITKEFEFYKFTVFWKDYINHITKEQELEILWNDSTNWTVKVISKNLVKELDDKFKINKKSWKEWRKFDLIVGTNDYFECIYGYDFEKTFEEYLKNTNKESLLDYPKHQLLLLEHENDYKTALNELIKLTYERAQYKVLITYTEKIKHRLALISNIHKILDQSDKYLPEYSSQYILVLGELINETIYWSFYQFRCNGVLVNSHFFTNTGEYKDFKKYPIWHDLKTVKFNSFENSIRWMDSVKPVKDKNDVIIHPMDKFIWQDYSESYYVSCNFGKNNEYSGYVHLSTDYYFWKDGEYEKYFEPIIIDKNTGIHIPLTINSKQRQQFLYDNLNLTPEELFPLKYEINAKLNGFNKSGELNI